MARIESVEPRTARTAHSAEAHADCHGHHDILPASDPKSTIAPGQLVTTCGKCHAGANASFVKYDPHANSHDAVHYPALHYVAVFMNVLLSGTLGFFALHTILWFFRSRYGPRGEAEPPVKSTRD